MSGFDAGHIEQEERGAIRTTQAHKHPCPLLPTAMAFVPFGFILVKVHYHQREYCDIPVCPKACACIKGRLAED